MWISSALICSILLLQKSFACTEKSKTHNKLTIHGDDDDVGIDGENMYGNRSNNNKMERLRLFVRLLAAIRYVNPMNSTPVRGVHTKWNEIVCVCAFLWTFCHSPFRSNEPIAKLYFFFSLCRFGSVRVCFIWFVSVPIFSFFYLPFRFAFSDKMSRHLPEFSCQRTPHQHTSS